MKTFGYPAGAPLNEHGLVELMKVSFQADAQTIRRIAKFLMEQADEMEARGKRFCHAHAQDEDCSWPEEMARYHRCGSD
jgi:hypothetical protein